MAILGGVSVTDLQMKGMLVKKMETKNHNQKGSDKESTDVNPHNTYCICMHEHTHTFTV